jgi:DNA-binding HxlR family transcriptional regulator
MNLLKVISKTGCEEILLKLYKEGESNFGKLAELTKHRATTTRSLKELQKAKLVDRKVMQDELRTVVYSLTEKGKSVGEILQQLKKLE